MSGEETASDLEQAILQIVRSPGYQPIKPRVLAKKLGLDKDDVPRVRKTIKRMVKRGVLSWGSKHLVQVASATPADRILGVFRRVKDGHGFVRPHTARPEDERQRDIFIPHGGGLDASTGDVVVVKIVKRKAAFGKPEGRVTEVVERDANRFVGTYFEDRGMGFVQVDGTLFSQPVPVGDPGAKNVRVDDKVVFEMVRFPSHANPGEGVITEVLGPLGAPGVDTQSIIYEFDLPGPFPLEVLEDARQQAARFDEGRLAGRRDLTGETIITIDPVDARDFDDAISLRHLENGHWLLGVHIADVAHFVPEGSPLDQEAQRRGNSCYLTDRVIPMLPELISNGLASLQPDRVRYVKTALIEFTSGGAPVGLELHHAAIRSARRFTYEEIDEYLADPAAWKDKLAPEVHALVGRMHTLAMILRKRRLKRGALELHMPEVKVDLDAEGKVVGAHVTPNTESHQMIEEFMLAANEAVAGRLQREGFLYLRRVHAPPSPRKMEGLTEFVRDLGFDVGSLEDRFALQRLLNETVGRPEQYSLHYAVLRSLARAVYSPEDEGHYALATDTYCHFTSPIRRYPDLVIHRLVNALLAGEPPRNDFGALARLGEHCSDTERRADAAEKELTRLKLLAYFREHVGDELDAVITGVEEFGMFARGQELPVEGLIHISSLDDRFFYDRTTHTLTGHQAGNQFRLGDQVRVKVVRVDMSRRELDFRLVRHKRRAASPSSRGRRDSSESNGRTSKARQRKSDASPRGRAKKTSPRKGSPRKGASGKGSRRTKREE